MNNASTSKRPSGSSPSKGEKTIRRRRYILVTSVAAGALLFGGASALLLQPAETMVVPEYVDKSVAQQVVSKPPPSRPSAQPHQQQGAEAAERATAQEPVAEEARFQEPSPEAPFELQLVAEALSTLEIDDEGNLVINDDMRTILASAFSDPEQGLTRAQLADLQELVRGGLGGKAGEQAAKIAGRYYEYSNAYRETAGTLEDHNSLSAAKSNFEHLSLLRRSHLGEELAGQLFSEEEERTRYTLELMIVQSNDELSPEEKARRQDEIRASSPDWLKEEWGENDEATQAGKTAQ